MSFWQLVDGVIRNPPVWLIAYGTVLFVTLLVMHVMTSTADIVTRLSTKKSLFEMLELLIVVMVAMLTFKSFYGKEVGGALHEWYDHPLFMLAILLMTTLASMVGYFKTIDKMQRKKLGDE